MSFRPTVPGVVDGTSRVHYRRASRCCDIGTPPRRIEAERKCNDCGTPLGHYNLSGRCYVCQPEYERRQRDAEVVRILADRHGCKASRRGWN